MTQDKAAETVERSGVKKSLTTADATFLREAAWYFGKRPTHGEDAAHWSNVMNAENCNRIAAAIESLSASTEEIRKAAFEEAAGVAENPGFIQARDTEWDSGVNYAKRYIAAAIRALVRGGCDG